MCHNRLDDGDAPACVEACPEGAIAIEIVNIAEWRRDYLSANAPGLPSADDSISTTRITLPENLTAGSRDAWIRSASSRNIRTGRWCSCWCSRSFPWARSRCCGCSTCWAAGTGLTIAALASLTLAGISLGASTLHLGRPIYAFRALEGPAAVVAEPRSADASLFAGAASAFAGMLLFDLPGAERRRFAAPLCRGLAGVTCSARIYVVPRAPRVVQRLYPGRVLFHRSAAGSAVCADAATAEPFHRAVRAGGGSAALPPIGHASCSSSCGFRARRCLNCGRRRYCFRAVCKICSWPAWPFWSSPVYLLPLVAARGWMIALAFAVALAGEWLGR